MVNTDEICVAVCADKNIEVGLHCTLYSLVSSQSSKVRIYFINNGYDAKSINKLHQTLSMTGKDYTLHSVPASASRFFNFQGLHGNHFAYMRLLLGSLLQNESRVIYLDSDLIVNKNLGGLWRLDITKNIIAAAEVGEVKRAHDGKSLMEMGLSAENRYFNSGVLLMDLSAWRQGQYEEQCFAVANKFPTLLKTADQTVLNFVFSRCFYPLDNSYNFGLYPRSRRIDQADDTIYHFIGSPKPWDIGGEFVHSNYPLFKTTLKQTGFHGYKSYFDLTPARLLRLARLSRSYCKSLGAMISEKINDITH